VVEVYRPVLGYLLDRPAPLVWFLGVTFVVGLAPLGSQPVFLATLLVALVASGLAATRWPGKVAAMASLVLIALVADQRMTPLGAEFLAPLDEGMVMDMPITVPRASVTESADDLKARDMILCRFPEVDMVVGKAGRAETPTDPAPMDMIETMVNFRPREFWPRRKLRTEDARQQGAAVLDALLARGVIRPPEDARVLLADSVAAALDRFDAQMREYAYHRNQELSRRLAREAEEALLDPHGTLDARSRSLWREHVKALDGDLLERAPLLYTRIVAEELLARATIEDAAVAEYLAALRASRVPVSSTSARGGIDLGPRRPSPRLPARRGPEHRAEPDLPGSLRRDLATVRPAAAALEGRPHRTVRVRRRAGPRRVDARLDKRLDHADPEPRRHAGHGRQHHGRRARARAEPGGRRRHVGGDRRRVETSPGRGGRGRRPDPGEGLS
jgi:hypothetical protein